MSRENLEYESPPASLPPETLEDTQPKLSHGEGINSQRRSHGLSSLLQGVGGRETLDTRLMSSLSGTGICILVPIALLSSSRAKAPPPKR